MSNAGHYILHSIKCPYCGRYQPTGTPSFEILVDFGVPVKLWRCCHCGEQFEMIITVKVEKHDGR